MEARFEDKARDSSDDPLSVDKQSIVSIPPPPPASSASARSVMQANRGTDTRPEIKLRSALHRLGYRFRKHASPLDDLRCRADIVFPRERVAVFVDGCFWHSCPDHAVLPRTNHAYWTAKLQRNAQRDARNNARLREAGWAPVRVWEHEALDDALDVVVTTLHCRKKQFHSERLETVWRDAQI
jgi:DNA mismatch endonuclease, patch repair protein